LLSAPSREFFPQKQIMHWLDNTILAVLAAAAVLGAYSGLLMQVFRLVGFGVALYAATTFNAGATAWLQESWMRGADERACTFVAYGGVFLGVYLAIFLATLVLERGLKAAQLQYLNRSLGAALAVAKMSLLIGVVCYGLQQFPNPQTKQVLEDSSMAPLLAKGVEQAVAAVPAEYKDELTTRWNQMREQLPAKNGS
jgi:uncharacterized membrane protein required for colicin V production